MAKGSGNIRSVANSAQSNWQADNEKVVNAIAGKEPIDYDLWQGLTFAEKELALMESGFTGLTSDSELEEANLYYAESKQELISTLAQDISNIVNGNSFDEATWTVGFKDGSVKRLDVIDNELGNLGITGKQSYKTEKAKVASALSDKKINFIIYTNGYDQPKFYATKSGKAALKQYGGFEEWKNGRGEKPRDYLQDDWL